MTTDIAHLGLQVDSRPVSKAERELNKFTRAGKKADVQAIKTGKSATLMGKGFTKAASGIGLAIGAMVGFAAVGTLREIASFEHGMSKVSAITKATTEDLEAMRDIAKELGATTEFSATQAAGGLEFLGRAGFNAADSIAALPATLDLATASGMDLARSADITSNIMSAFSIEAANAASVTDVLAAASSSANTDVEQMGTAMKFVGPIASAMGVSVGDAAAAIGVLSDAGLQGTMAGTGLRRIMSSLANATPAATKVIKSMRLEMEDLDPATNSLVDIISKLEEVGITAAEALEIFGDRGGPALLALVGNVPKLRELTTALTDVEGEAKRMADTIRDDVLGDAQELKSTVAGLAIALGEAGLTTVMRIALQGLTGFTRGVIATVNAFERLIGKVPNAIDWMNNLNSAQDIYDITLDNVVQGLSDEIIQTQLLSGVLSESTIMSVQAAQEKLKEAQARHANAAAAVEEQHALALNTEAYKDARFAYDSAVSAARSISLRNADAIEMQEQNAIRALKSMDALLQPTAEMLKYLEQTGINMDALSEALAGAKDGFVTLGDGMVVPIENSDLISRALVEVEKKLTNAETAAEKLTDELETSLAGAISEVEGAFKDWMGRGFKDFESFAKSILDSFKQLLIDMAFAAFKNKILINIGTEGSTMNKLFGGDTGGAIGGMLGGFTSAIGAGASGVITGLFEGGLSGAFGSFSTAMGGATASLAGFGTALGAALPFIAAGVAVFSFLKKKTIDQGIGGTLGGEAGFDGYSYEKTSQFWGLSKKTSTTGLGGEVTDPIAQAFNGMRDTVIDMGDAIGAGAQGALDDFTHEFKFSTKGLSEEEIGRKIQEEMGIATEAMAALTLGTTEYNKLGETAVQTLERLSTNLTVVNRHFDMLGLRLFDVSIAGAAAASSIVEMFDSAQAFSSAADFYLQNFYSDAERMDIATRSLSETLAAIGVDAIPASEAAFRRLVDSMQEIGDSEAVGTLLKIAPAFIDLMAAGDKLAASTSRLTHQFATRADQEFAKGGLYDFSSFDAAEDDAATKELLRELVAEIRRGNLTLASNTAKTAKILTRMELKQDTVTT